MRMICCGKEFCISCDYDWEEHGGPKGCPYCRAPLPCGDEEKVALIRAKAEQGKGYAIYLMGEMHKNGHFGVERNLNLAIEWLSKGDPWCTWLLGRCYEVDSHLDHAKAFSLFLEAAAANVPVANTALATCYLVGRGTEQDQAKGMQLLAKASRQGELGGMAKLAICLYTHDLSGNEHEVDCLVVAPSMLALARAIKSVFPGTPPKYLNDCLELIWQIEETISHVCARCRIKIDHGPWCSTATRLGTARRSADASTRQRTSNHAVTATNFCHRCACLKGNGDAWPMASMAWGRGPPKCCTTVENSLLVLVQYRVHAVLWCVGAGGHGMRIAGVPRACNP